MKKLILSLMFVVCMSFAATSINAQSESSDDAQRPKNGLEVRDYMILNETGMTINSVFFSPADLDKYGDNILAKTSISNDKSLNYRWAEYPAEQCWWDVKYVGPDGTVYMMENVDLCLSKTITLKPITR